MQPDDEARLARLERQVSYLLEHLGLNADIAADGGAGFGYAAMPVPGPPGPLSGMTIPPQLAAALQGGKMIEAIKICRGMTGMGLKEAKAAVEAMARDMGVRY
jgi:ribosomal protein L7/L12